VGAEMDAGQMLVFLTVVALPAEPPSFFLNEWTMTGQDFAVSSLELSTHPV
jgi:hypothetical protein